MSNLPVPGGSNQSHGIIDEKYDKYVIPAFAVLTGFALALAYLTTITKHRLWSTSPFLDKLPQIVSNPIAHALSIGIGLVAVVPYHNELYIIWLVVLALVFDNVQSIANYSLIDQGSDKMSQEYIFLYNCVLIGSILIRTQADSMFYRPLIALWSLLVLKFLERQFNYRIADRAYGIKNTNLIADYMETEHTLSNQINPQTMEGYKYLVMGEETANYIVEPPQYALEFEKSTNKVVTIERVWGCKKRILDPTIDKHDKIKDLCLSFALFKLIRRRFLGFRAREALEPKTKQFVFEGLLSRDKETVFRVIKTELSFLRDFFYSRHPVTFALGIPVFNVLILIAVCGISAWISVKVFLHKKVHDRNSFLIINHNNIDFRITSGLLLLIIATESFEVLSYLFSDWMKVIMICRHVRSTLGTIPIIDRIASLLVKVRFSASLKNTIGQYSLLRSYNKGGCSRVTNNCIHHTTCAMVGTLMPRGMNADKEVILPVEVKAAVFDALKISEGKFTDRLAPLRRNEVADDLSWLAFIRSPLLNIMVWHIATSMCEIRPVLTQPIIEDTNCLFACFTNCVPKCFRKSDTPEEEAIKSHRLVASSLSKYCAYLVVFAPELLPTSINSANRILDKIVLETSKFFKKTHGPKAQYEKMMEVDEKEEKVDRVIDMGAKLGRYLMQIEDDVKRWKVMADVWSELILYVAPSGHTDGHLKSISIGGEFITHLWALLYHAGIGSTGAEEMH